MSRQGVLVQNLSELEYKSFKPTPLPPVPKLVISSSITKKLVEANRSLDDILNPNLDANKNEHELFLYSTV